MDQARIRRLVKRYIDGIATIAEEEELMHWYRKKGNQQAEWVGTLGEEKIVRDRILGNIRQKTTQPHKRISRWHYGLVASLLVSLTIASVYYFKSPTKLAALEQVNSNINPGKNQAVLILSNGIKISLNDTKHGLLAKQGSVIIKRAKNGQIIYDLSGGKKGESNTSAFNTIVTPRGGQYSIILPDGSKVWLNSESSLRFPTEFKGKERDVQLTGEGYFEVAKNKKLPFKVDARGTQVEVLGTHFNINAYDNENSVNTTLLEGSVKVSHSRVSKLIKPGQQAQVGSGIKIDDVDAEQFIAWKNGLFVFNDEDIHTLMNSIARWYDVEIKYEDGIDNQKFSGSISKYKDVGQILKKMELTKTIHFKIEGRRITVMK